MTYLPTFTCPHCGNVSYPRGDVITLCDCPAAKKERLVQQINKSRRGKRRDRGRTK